MAFMMGEVELSAATEELLTQLLQISGTNLSVTHTDTASRWKNSNWAIRSNK